MYVNREINLAFLAHPHMASRSVSEALMAIGFKLSRGHHYGPIPKDKHYVGLRYFCIVRNHWDVMASWFISKTNIHKPAALKADWVEAWVTRHVKRRRSYCNAHRLMYFRDEVPETLCIRFENLQEELDILLSLWNLPPVILPHVGSKKRKGRPYQLIHSEGSRDWIADYFADEIEELGYTYDSFNP